MSGHEISLKEQAIDILSDGGFVLKKCNSERDVKAEVRRFLRRYAPIWIFMPVQTGFGVSGTPDFVGCYMGYAFGIETKFNKAKCTAMQVRQQDEMVSAGAEIFVVSESNFHTFIRAWEQFVIICGGVVK
jgi:hypothetical protein